MFKLNRILILLLITTVGLAVWQTNRLYNQQKVIRNHLAYTAVHSAAYLYTLQQTIDSINQKNTWDDNNSLQGIQNIINITKQSIEDTNADFQAFNDEIPSNIEIAMNDFYFRFFDYQMKVMTILGKAGHYSEYDKIQISEINRVLANVPDFYPQKIHDLDDVSDAFLRLNQAWAAEPPFPDISDVESISYHMTALSAKDDPKPLYTKNAADKAIIEKIIGYLQTAKSEGYDDNVPSMSIPTNLADIQLKAGSVLTLSPAAKDRVYVFMSSIKKTIRVFSPELSDWLYTGWKKDITKKH